MKTVIGVVHTTESGDVKSITISDDSIYRHVTSLTTYDAPYLGSYENGDEWRRALGAYLIDLVHTNFSVGGCHGDRVVYTSPACGVYVYEIDFDSV